MLQIPNIGTSWHTTPNPEKQDLAMSSPNPSSHGGRLVDPNENFPIRLHVLHCQQDLSPPGELMGMHYAPTMFWQWPMYFFVYALKCLMYRSSRYSSNNLLFIQIHYHISYINIHSNPQKDRKVKPYPFYNGDRFLCYPFCGLYTYTDSCNPNK
jgi:hypothetical protein